MVDLNDGDEGGPRLRDLAKDGGLSEIIEREKAPLERQVAAYREAAVERELQLRARAAAEADIATEADRRSSGRRLRSV